MEDLSVIIITRNRLDKLKRCVGSVQEKLPTAEIIVVDNGSTDRTKEYLADSSKITSVCLNINVGVAKGRNLGIVKARGEFVMFLDDDAWIESIDFEKIKIYFNEHFDIGIIAPRLLYPNGKIQESVRSFPTISALFWRGSGLYKLMPNVYFYKKYVNFESSRIQTVDWTMGACQIVRREIFKSVGYFDEHYFFVYDDVDFCYRVKKVGYKVIFWPEATVFHEYARSSARKIGRPLISHIISISRFFWKRAKK